MAHEIISKDGKYVISVDIDSEFEPDPVDNKTDYFLMVKTCVAKVSTKKQN